MSIVVYRCDVCKRERDFQRNITGLETMQRCTITHGCRGVLQQVQVLSDFIRPRRPEPVLGLSDWRQRRVLYNHTQTIDSMRWTIEHNLGTFPSLSVFIDAATEENPEARIEIIPIDVIVLNENSIEVVFDRLVSGVAQLVARQSDPNLLNPIITAPISTTLQQISSSGEITIATRINTVGDCLDIGLTVNYNTAQNSIITNTYTNVTTNLVGSNSPWLDFDVVVIQGRLYSVRTYSAIYSAILDDSISNGSTFIYTGISPCPPTPTSRPIVQNEVYILLANTPFNIVDKNTNQYIDVFDISDTQNTFAMLYDSGEFFADSTIIRNTYPPIRDV